LQRKAGGGGVHRVAPMADGGGTVLARGEEVAAFIAVCKAVREVSLRTKGTKSWHGPRHGRSTARGRGGGGRRRAACMPARGWLGGAARYGSIAAHGREARGAKEEGGAWTSGQKPASACGRARSRRGWRVTPARRRALWTTGLKPFRLTPFDRAFLQLFQLKWTKRSTAKL
jgi:hypothetical protein